MNAIIFNLSRKQFLITNLDVFAIFVEKFYIYYLPGIMAPFSSDSNALL